MGNLNGNIFKSALGTPTGGDLSNCTSNTETAANNSTQLATTAYADRLTGGTLAGAFTTLSASGLASLSGGMWARGAGADAANSGGAYTRYGANGFQMWQSNTAETELHGHIYAGAWYTPIKISSTGLVVTGAISATGILSTTDATNATSATAASLKTAGGIACVKSAWIGANAIVAGKVLIGLTASNTAFDGELQYESTVCTTSLVRYSVAAAGAPGLYLAHSRGATVGTNTIVAANDTLGTIIFSGANGTGYSDAAWIQGRVDGTPGASADMPGRLVFLTSADGSATPTERLRISSTGLSSFTGAVTISTTLVVTGALTTNGGLQTFGANDSGGAGYRQVVVPNV